MKIYFVINENGDYYVNRYSFGSIEKAKLNKKPGPMKSIVTWLKNNYPDKPICRLVEYDLTLLTPTVIDMVDHVKTSITNKNKKQSKEEKLRIKREMESLQRQEELLKEKQKKLELLSKNYI